MKTFITDYINNDALIEDIDKYVNYWTEHQKELNCSLREYLGMSIDEYGYFLLDEDFLLDIVTSRKEGITIENFIKNKKQKDVK